MTQEKEIRWIGSSYDDLLAFSDAPRREAGFQLGMVQAGLEAEDWKPSMKRVPEPRKFVFVTAAASIA